ncbi:MAG: hypothetical protein ACP5GH_01465 [Nitrososphaeria archaeon]
MSADKIKELFLLALNERDKRKLYTDVELLIFLIKTQHNLEIPFSREHGGSIERALRLYEMGNYEECVRELRKVKHDIIRSARRGL